MANNSGFSPNPPPMTPPKPAASTGIGSYTTGINAGPIPQQTIDQGMSAMQAKPPAMYDRLGPVFQNLLQSQGQAGALDLSRQSAPAQANLLLGSQTANANAGLQNAGLLSRLQQDQFAASAPQRNLLNQLLGNAFQQMG